MRFSWGGRWTGTDYDGRRTTERLLSRRRRAREKGETVRGYCSGRIHEWYLFQGEWYCSGCRKRVPTVIY